MSCLLDQSFYLDNYKPVVEFHSTAYFLTPLHSIFSSTTLTTNCIRYMKDDHYDQDYICFLLSIDMVLSLFKVVRLIWLRGICLVNNCLSLHIQNIHFTFVLWHNIIPTSYKFFRLFHALDVFINHFDIFLCTFFLNRPPRRIHLFLVELMAIIEYI